MKQYEKACETLKRNPLQLSDFDFLPEGQRVSAFGEHKVITCIEARNKGWKPNWLDNNECKWRIWFEAKEDKNRPGGVGFSFGVSGGDDSYTLFGSRLYCKTEAIADEVGNDPEILEYYNEWILM